jgi:hypothetical protein
MMRTSQSQPDGAVPRYDWVRLRDSTLLDRPLRSLGLRIEGSPLESRIQRLYGELERAGLRFRPHVWLSTDWFSPHGVGGFAAPFYLVHRRLARLEERIMLEVEGGGLDQCMRLLRHETAHAIDHAYRLHWRKRWREVFGRASEPYRSTYVPHLTSQDYVHNLDYFYSQSHPCEDFAETFSIWLQPRSRWRKRYKGWPALRKLEFVDALMKEIATERPRVRTRARPDAVSGLRQTLREHYRRKQIHYGSDYTSEHDEYLTRVFSSDPGDGRRETAARYLLRSRLRLRKHVAVVTGQHQYVIDQVLNELVLRCRRLELWVGGAEHDTTIEATALLTALTVGLLRNRPMEYSR